MPRALWVARALMTALVTIAVASAAGCSAEHATVTDGARPGCITGFDPAADYFPDKSTLSEATNFRLEYHRSYRTRRRPRSARRPRPRRPRTSGRGVSYDVADATPLRRSRPGPGHA